MIRIRQGTTTMALVLFYRGSRRKYMLWILFNISDELTGVLHCTRSHGRYLICICILFCCVMGDSRHESGKYVCSCNFLENRGKLLPSSFFIYLFPPNFTILPLILLPTSTSISIHFHPKMDENSR